jgi:hypothetical protein
MIKGLESEAIVYFINAVNINLEKHLYISASRAIGYLNIVINRSAIAKISRLKRNYFN